MELTTLAYEAGGDGVDVATVARPDRGNAVDQAMHDEPAAPQAESERAFDPGRRITPGVH